jgi:DNA-binding FadR family transcriptional regulator
MIARSALEPIAAQMAALLAQEHRRSLIEAMAQAAMPRIRFNRIEREWTCSDRTACFAYAWGDSPDEAYERWRRKFWAWAEGALS